ncbi:hypothetical protein SAMN05216354_2797 [Xylanibacter ruminicola]|uniref:Uncharacterized protein n=1 Tax=Xylanibacter ruminicola TaxID=839 RepID=A0A1H5XHP0_XYLRU|nr:hypothetical protein SAMN05216354_2797 [Xylanibacter ruminicola]
MHFLTRFNQKEVKKNIKIYLSDFFFVYLHHHTCESKNNIIPTGYCRPFDIKYRYTEI